jgi:hypothetical protein
MGRGRGQAADISFLCDNVGACCDTGDQVFCPDQVAFAPLPSHAQGTDAGALDYALNRAIDAWYNDRAWFHSLQRRVMEQDWSWNRPALDYIELYYGTVKENS